MNMPATTPASVHLVGSVPLKDADAVFRAVSDAVGPYLRRIPDGETGKRKLWIGMISALLNKHADFEIDRDAPPLQMKLWNGQLHREIRQLRFKQGVNPDLVVFDTGYAAMAIESYAGFDELQRRGVIPAGVRFQIAIPSAMAPACNYIVPADQETFLRVFVAHLSGEVKKIAAALPAGKISIQWDVLQEILLWENYFPSRPANYRERIFSSLAAVGNAVPMPIELGYHLCYGSPKDEHLVQPRNTAVMVELIHGLLAALERPVQFIHLPVPKARTDDGYFRPLASLKLPPQSELYLGLIHQDDDEGNRARIATARRFISFAGVGTECGWGRGDPERVPALLRTHRTAVEWMRMQ